MRRLQIATIKIIAQAGMGSAPFHHKIVESIIKYHFNAIMVQLTVRTCHRTTTSQNFTSRFGPISTQAQQY